MAKKLAMRDFDHQELIHQDAAMFNYIRGCAENFRDMQKHSLKSAENPFSTSSGQSKQAILESIQASF